MKKGIALLRITKLLEIYVQIKKRATKQVLRTTLREQVWLKVFCKTLSNKCYIAWCSNKITPFDFHICHTIPICKGVKTRSIVCSPFVVDATYR